MTRDWLFSRYSPPLFNFSFGDGAGDYDALWALVKLMAPMEIVELGTRGGVSARVILDAAPRAVFTTIDIDNCNAYVADMPLFYIHDDAANVFNNWKNRNPQFLFIDTDPHSKEQTLGWLDTWVSHRLEPLGMAAFHDTRPGGGVHSAIMEWLQTHPEWQFYELGIGNGMGVLAASTVFELLKAQ